MPSNLILPNQRKPQPHPAAGSEGLEVVMPPVQQWLATRRAAPKPEAGPSGPKQPVPGQG